MKSPFSFHIAAALVSITMTVAVVSAMANYALPQVAAPVLAKAAATVVS
ncbi:hypothetical protein [Rhodoferax sp.]|nr:hypothetical protein [Rhodoferax sp.]